MIFKFRNNAPACWIFLPILLVCAVSGLVSSAADNPVVAGAAVLVVSLLAAAWTEWRLRSVINAISSIAAGDRYAALPERIGGGAMVEIATAAERMRQSLIDALEHGTIKVGILHSLSGTVTASERPLQELAVMLIEQQNARGGLLGRPIEPIIMNPRSDAKAYAEQARMLLVEHKVAAIFGCWTSASRKEVLPIVERENGLLFYPSQYEGEETSANIFYTGATPHQQALPAINFLRSQGYQRFFLIGTDYIYPRTTNAVLRNYLAANGILGSDVVERYTPFGFDNWRAAIEEVRRFAKRGNAAIVATITGDADLHFFRELARQGVTAQVMPVMSLSTRRSCRRSCARI
jgi:urea transport system substrate-binding protein